MSNDSLYEDTDTGSLINVEDEGSDEDSLLQSDPIDNGTSVEQQATKAIDAAEDSADIHDEEGLPPPASSSARRVWLENAPLRDAGPAPPDYAEATAWRRALRARRNTQRVDESDEDLYGAIRLPESQRPSSIPPDYADEDADNPISFRRIIPTKIVSSKRRWRYLGWIIGTYMAIMLMFATPWLIRARYGSPFQRMAVRDHPSALNECRFTTYSEYAKYRFDKVDNFYFEYESYPELYPDVTFSRHLNVYPAPPQQKVDIEIWMNVATSASYSVAKFSALEKMDGIYLRDPFLHSGNYPDVRWPRLVSERKQSCADIWISIFVRPEAEAWWFQVQTDRVNTFWGYGDTAQWAGRRGQGTHDLPLNKTFTVVELWTSVANIDARYLDATYLDLVTEIGNITGTYALRENMNFVGDSGYLDITVDPKTCNTSDSTCAKFSLSGRLDRNGVERPNVSPHHVLGPSSNVTLSHKMEFLFDEDESRGPLESARLSLARKGYDTWGDAAPVRASAEVEFSNLGVDEEHLIVYKRSFAD